MKERVRWTPISLALSLTKTNYGPLLAERGTRKIRGPRNKGRLRIPVNLSLMQGVPQPVVPGSSFG